MIQVDTIGDGQIKIEGMPSQMHGRTIEENMGLQIYTLFSHSCLSFVRSCLSLGLGKGI